MAVPGRKAPKIPSLLLPSNAGSKDKNTLFCEPCDKDGTRRTSYGYCIDCEDRLCQACFDSHRNAKSCQKHTVLDNATMTECNRLSSKSAGMGHHSDLKTPCPKHPKKMIEFYCNCHDTILCCVCVTLEHTRKTCEVEYIPNVSGKIVNSREFNDTIKNIDVLMSQCTKVKTEIINTIEYSNRSLSSAMKELKKHREIINKILDELEEEVQKTAKVFQHENDTRLKTMESLYDDIYRSLESSRDTVTHLNVSKQAPGLFVELKLAQEVNKDHELSIANLTGVENITRYRFKPNEAIPTCLKHEISLGIIEPEDDFQLPKLPTATPSYHGDICVQTTEDKMRCQITGMVHIFPDKLVLVDHNNETVKMVDVKTQQVTGQETLSSEPWDVCAVTNTELAITLPFEQTIQFVSVAADTLTKTRSIKVAGQCRGISCHQGNLVVTYINFGKLQIMNLQGAVLTTVRTNANDEDIFHRPYYVKVNSESVYVSDYATEASSVIILNWQGEITSRFENLDEAEGLVLTKDGVVYVCEWGKDRIRKIRDGTKGEVAVKDLDRPQAVGWREEDSILYISSPLDEKYANFLKVYQIQ